VSPKRVFGHWCEALSVWKPPIGAGVSFLVLPVRVHRNRRLCAPPRDYPPGYRPELRLAFPRAEYKFCISNLCITTTNGRYPCVSSQSQQRPSQLQRCFRRLRLRPITMGAARSNRVTSAGRRQGCQTRCSVAGARAQRRQAVAQAGGELRRRLRRQLRRPEQEEECINHPAFGADSRLRLRGLCGAFFMAGEHPQHGCVPKGAPGGGLLRIGQLLPPRRPACRCRSKQTSQTSRGFAGI
jgi:hypothetical protein